MPALAKSMASSSDVRRAPWTHGSRTLFHRSTCCYYTLLGICMPLRNAWPCEGPWEGVEPRAHLAAYASRAHYGEAPVEPYMLVGLCTLLSLARWLCSQTGYSDHDTTCGFPVLIC